MKKKVFLFTLFFTRFETQVLFDLHGLNEQYENKILLTQYYVDKLYQLIKDVHEVFEFFGIEYWIQGGTLVGALRHGGLMWWDDDVDINVKITDVPKILALAPLFKLLGYAVGERFFKTLHVVKIGNLKQFVVDICPTIHENGKTRYSNHWWKRNGDPIYLYDSELYPLVKYPFGQLQLWGPKNPFVYLRCGFGNNYMTEVNIYNHHVKKGMKYSFKEFPSEFQTHAKPSKPLENRVAKLNLKDFKIDQ